MTEIIENLDELPGREVNDQEGRKVGKVQALYGAGDEQEPMWVTVDAAAGGKARFIPVARLKEEKGELRVPYSKEHIENAPEVDADAELSEEDDRELRNYYAIDLADQEVRAKTESYAARVPTDGGGATKLDEASGRDRSSDDDEDASGERHDEDEDDG